MTELPKVADRVRQALACLSAGPASKSEDGSWRTIGSGEPIAPAILDFLLRASLAECRNDVLQLTPRGRRLAAAGPAPDFTELKRVVVRDVLEEGGSRRMVDRMACESPIDILRQRRGKGGEPWLTQREWAAGDRLRSDFTRGQMLPSIGMRWSHEPAGTCPRGAGGKPDIADAALAARMRVEKAVDAVGPELSGVLLDACCFLKGLEVIEAERGWPKRSAKLILKTALSALARHYDPDTGRSAKTRVWTGDQEARAASA